MSLTSISSGRLDLMFQPDTLNTNPVGGMWIRVCRTRLPSFMCLEQELKEREHFIWLNFLKNWLICVQIWDNFWVFDKYFRNQSPPHPMNVHGSPLHPCQEILNVDCSGIGSGTRTVHCWLLAVMFVYLVLDESHIDIKWKTWPHVPTRYFKHKPCWGDVN